MSYPTSPRRIKKDSKAIKETSTKTIPVAQIEQLQRNKVHQKVKKLQYSQIFAAATINVNGKNRKDIYYLVSNDDMIINVDKNFEQTAAI